MDKHFIGNLIVKTKSFNIISVLGLDVNDVCKAERFK